MSLLTREEKPYLSAEVEIWMALGITRAVFSFVMASTLWNGMVSCGCVCMCVWVGVCGCVCACVCVRACTCSLPEHGIRSEKKKSKGERESMYMNMYVWIHNNILYKRVDKLLHCSPVFPTRIYLRRSRANTEWHRAVHGSGCLAEEHTSNLRTKCYKVLLQLQTYSKPLNDSRMYMYKSGRTCM